MNKKKNGRLDLQSKLLIAAAVIIAGLVCYMCVEKVIDNKNAAAYEARSIELQQTIARLEAELYLGKGDSKDDDDEADSVDSEEDYWEKAAMEFQDELISVYYTDEDIADTMAKILFRKAILKITDLRISDMNEYPESEPQVTTEINEKTYIKRDVLYADVVKEYSRIFTGDLLDDLLSERFIEKDGYLYVLEGGGDGGTDIYEVELTKASESDGEITYSVKYNTKAMNGDVSDYSTCTITLKAVDNGYALSQFDFDDAE